MQHLSHEDASTRCEHESSQDVSIADSLRAYSAHLIGVAHYRAWSEGRGTKGHPSAACKQLSAIALAYSDDITRILPLEH